MIPTKSGNCKVCGIGLAGTQYTGINPEGNQLYILLPLVGKPIVLNSGDKLCVSCGNTSTWYKKVVKDDTS